MKFYTFQPQFREIASYIGETVLRLSNQRRGPFTVVGKQVGTEFFENYTAFYNGAPILQMFEARGKDYDYSIVIITNNTNILTEFVQSPMIY